jgi:tetratricopeptide (TPR) repeat protein
VTDSKELVARAGDYADGGKPDEAMELVNQVLLNEPDNPGALYVATSVLLQAARHVQAIQMAKRICEIAPRDPRGWGMLCLIYGELHKYDESIRMGEKALMLRRDCKTLADAAYAHVNGGNWSVADKLSREAIETARAQGDKQNALKDALVSQAYVRLAVGDWPSGFEGYRRTMRTKWRKEWTYGDSKEWQGEPDAVVMVTGEQGLGDEIMAASVVPDAAKACQRFILDCDHRLAPLFQRSFRGVLVSPTRREQTVTLPVMPTHHKSLFGLGELFRTSDDSFPRAAYLVPDPDYVRMFKALLRPGTVGLAWSGGLPRTGVEPRTAGLSAFLPLVRRGGHYLSLQYKDDAAEVAEFRRQYGITVQRLPWVTCGADQDLLAGLLAALDEVVGVHTSAMHLASALGVPTTILTHRGSGWRYAPQELLWYPPTTQMWKKRAGESWRDCVGRLTEAQKAEPSIDRQKTVKRPSMQASA